MAWVKVPAEHHSIFLAALPKDRRISTLQMFGGIGIKVGGHMAGGLFGRSAIVRLNAADREAALALDGAEPFDPMGTGRMSSNMIMLPEDVMGEPDELRAWIVKAIECAAALPPKATKQPAVKKKPAAKKAPPKTKAAPKKAKANLSRSRATSRA